MAEVTDEGAIEILAYDEIVRSISPHFLEITRYDHIEINIEITPLGQFMRGIEYLHLIPPSLELWQVPFGQMMYHPVWFARQTSDVISEHMELEVLVLEPLHTVIEIDDIFRTI